MKTIKDVSDIMKDIQNNILIYIEREDDIEEHFQNLMILFPEHKVKNNNYIIISILHMLTAISNNHYRGVGFFDKLEKIILFFKDEIINNFSKRSIFNIVKSNKILLLFFIEEKILTFDQYIYEKITNKEFSNLKYPQYFDLEIKTFLSKEKINEGNYVCNNNNEEFNKKRRIGENDDYICKLIQKDSIEDFIIYVNKNNYSLNSYIHQSIFETNQFLLERTREKNNEYSNKKIVEKEYNFTISLIEYAAFYGSTQIFKYLYKNGVHLKKSLWNFAIHGFCPEIIHILEEEKIQPYSFEKCLIESIKCHHNDIGNYIESNYLNYQQIEKSFNMFRQILKQYNFAFINDYFICQTSLYYLCKYDYPLYIETLFKVNFIDINNVIISYYYSKRIILSIINYILFKYIMIFIINQINDIYKIRFSNQIYLSIFFHVISFVIYIKFV